MAKRDFSRKDLSGNRGQDEIIWRRKVTDLEHRHRERVYVDRLPQLSFKDGSYSVGTMRQLNGFTSHDPLWRHPDPAPNDCHPCHSLTHGASSGVRFDVRQSKVTEQSMSGVVNEHIELGNFTSDHSW